VRLISNYIVSLNKHGFAQSKGALQDHQRLQETNRMLANVLGIRNYDRHWRLFRNGGAPHRAKWQPSDDILHGNRLCYLSCHHLRLLQINMHRPSRPQYHFLAALPAIIVKNMLSVPTCSQKGDGTLSDLPEMHR
jgi:hypothetical protein